MRIAVLGPTFPYKGGIAIHTTQLAHRLADRGHDVALLSWSAQYPNVLYPGEQRIAVPEVEPFPVTSYPLSWRRPDSWVRVGRRLRRDADAVIVAHTTPVQAPAYATLLGAVGHDARRLVVCHNVVAHEARAIDPMLVREVLRRAEAAVVHSSGERAEALSLAGSLEVAVTPLPPGPRDFDNISAVDPGRPVQRRLLFFGLVRPYKGLDVLLRALATGPPDVDLIVAGEFWGGTESTERLIAELGLTKRVDLRAGYVPSDDIPDLFAAADALVLPYRTATGTWTGLLGHAYGVPVVATRVGAMVDQVEDGVDGMLCRPDDAADLARALVQLYEPGELARLRAGITPPQPQRMWSQYVDVVEGLLEPRGGASAQRRP